MELKIGDILNTKNPMNYSLKSITGWIFKLGVFVYQDRMFNRVKERESLWATHSRLYLGENKWLSVTSPKAIIEEIDINTFKSPYTILRYVHIDKFQETQFSAMFNMAEMIKGTGYDYAQIGAMLLHSLFPNLVSDESKLLKANGDKVVCSVGALACLLAAWKTTDRSFERPGGDPINGDGIYLEEFPPAGFNYHPTFKLVFSKKW